MVFCEPEKEAKERMDSEKEYGIMNDPFRTDTYQWQMYPSMQGRRC